MVVFRDSSRQPRPPPSEDSAEDPPESYERLVDLRGRLWRDTQAGETFVWTGEPPRTGEE
jgi:hypothetical protein